MSEHRCLQRSVSREFTDGRRRHQMWSHHRVHRFFPRAAWDPRKVGLTLAGAVIEALVPAGAPFRAGRGG
jgi:hypothetical protein